MIEIDPDEPKLGPCCICETTDGVRNIVMLNRRGVVEGHGWGCIQCDLPSNGAIVVLCDECLPIWQGDEGALRFACRGYPVSEGRIPISDLPEGHFDHDPSKHPEEERA